MLDFDLTNVASVLGLPGLYSLLRKALLTQLANYMVLPNKIVLPLSQEISASHLKFSEPKVHAICCFVGSSCRWQANILTFIV